MASKNLTVATSAAIQEIYNRSIAITGMRKDLETENKSSLVAATNEIVEDVNKLKLEYWNAVLVPYRGPSSSAQWFPIGHIDCSEDSFEFTLLIKYFECGSFDYEGTNNDVQGGEITFHAKHVSNDWNCISGSQNGHGISENKIRICFDQDSNIAYIYLYCTANHAPLIAARYVDNMRNNNVTWEENLKKMSTEPITNNYYDIYFLTAFSKEEEEAENVFTDFYGGTFFTVENGICNVRGEITFTSAYSSAQKLCKGFPKPRNGQTIFPAYADNKQAAILTEDGDLYLLNNDVLGDTVIFNFSYPLITYDHYVT